MNFRQALTTYVPKIQSELRRLMAPPSRSVEDFGQTSEEVGGSSFANTTLDPFYGMMHYHLGWLDMNFEAVQTSSGKMLRPVYTLLACQAAGGEPDRALPAAAAVELIHNFSLVHDDIEDKSDTRRGRATVWSLWGEAQAINVGDSLFVLARNALLDLKGSQVPSDVILQAVEKLDQTCLALCRGQYLDMSFEDSFEVGLAAYLEMIEGKTASLLACAGYLGGLIATANAGKAGVYWQLGLSLGIAFQIHDDLLGIWGDKAVTGKPAGDDLWRRKKSLPVVYGLNHSDVAKATRLKSIYELHEIGDADIAEAISILEAVGAKEYAEERARKYINQAYVALDSIEATEENKLALQEMAQFMIERAY